MASRKKSKKASPPNPNPLIWIGIFIFLISTFYQLLSHAPTTSTYIPPSKIIYNSPRSLSIPTLQINTTIVAGGIENGQWILDDQNALYLPTSGKVGEGYNTIIYAHAKEGLFLNLKNVKPTDKIVLEDWQGRKLTYQVYSVEIIKPTQVEKLKSDIPNSLTLFTCDGIFDESRVLVKAKMEFFSL